MDNQDEQVIVVPPGTQVLLMQATAEATVTRADGTIKE